jgi:O-acetyl-ADP-ribose deacetylase (regulator of RNase III)
MGYSLPLGNFQIQLVQGDLARETSDIIVNLNDDKLSCTNIQSKKLIDEAGDQIKRSCQ